MTNPSSAKPRVMSNANLPPALLAEVKAAESDRSLSDWFIVMEATDRGAVTAYEGADRAQAEAMYERLNHAIFQRRRSRSGRLGMLVESFRSWE